MATGLRATAEQIQNFILATVEANPKDVARVTGEQFHLSRQSIFRHLKHLVAKGVLEATGKTRARRYVLRILSRVDETISVSPDFQEDIIWRERVLPVV
ncbi:MAG: helix-turn-helix domain-containing protein, partial [Chloroflexota bacterium]|nr:helix-turn-helix domain-containing protein [Chloroflexota bacterium]